MTGCCFFLVLAPWVPAAQAVPTCDTSWATYSSGFWDVAANWTNGVPTSSSNACITVGGAYTVTVRRSTNVAAGLTLGMPGSSGQTLQVSGSAGAGDAKLTLLNQGAFSSGIYQSRLVLTTTATKASATVDIAGGTLNNVGGEINVAPGAGDTGGRFWHGALQQSSATVTIDENLTVLGAEPWHTNGFFSIAAGKTLRVDAGLEFAGVLSGDGTVQGDLTVLRGFVVPGDEDGVIGALTISGNYTHGGPDKPPQGSGTGAYLWIDVNGPNVGQFDVLRVTHAATVRALLLLRNTFNATLGQTFPILTAASRTGSFRTVSGAVIDRSSALYYAPTYPPNGVTLEVRRATTSIAPSDGPPGTSVTLNGSGWTAGDRVNVLLTDSARHKYKFSPATVDGSGNFSATITIPAGAASGAATIKLQGSMIKGLFVKKTFTIH